MAVAEAQGLVQSSRVYTNLVVLSNFFLVTSAYMIVVRPLASFC
jgi:hypothetical protein